MAMEPGVDDVPTGGTPFGINLAVGVVAVVTAAFGAAALSADVWVRLVVMVLAVVASATVLTDTRASFATAGLGYLLFNGFLVNRFGGLSWDGTAWPMHLAGFAAAVGFGLGLRRIRAARAEAAVAAEVEVEVEAILDEDGRWLRGH